MKKLLPLLFFCVLWMGEVRGQGEQRNTSVLCPGDMWILPDQYFFVMLDATGAFYADCNGIPSPGGENVIHFTIPCTNTYTIEYQTSDDISVSYRIYNPNFCDSSGYTCLTPVYLGNNVYKIDLALDSAISYDLLFENNNPVFSGASQLILKMPHVSNFQLYNITPDSVTASWDGGASVDEFVIEYGLKDFIPGSDTIPGTNGTIVLNPVSPYTFTGLIPDSVYDFYLRDKYCGIFSSNIILLRKRIPKCSSLTSLNCNMNFSYMFSADTADECGSWILNGCGQTVHTTREKIFKIVADTTGIYSIHHYWTGQFGLEFGLYYKESSLICNENNWTCIGSGPNPADWDLNFGPLQAGTAYDLLIKSNHLTSVNYTGAFFKLNCPSPTCSTAPDSITSNATNNTICTGQSVTLTQVGGVLSQNGYFNWYADSCGGTIIQNGYIYTVSPVDTTTYFVRAVDSCGVTTCASITINVNPPALPVIVTNPPSFCQGDSVVVVANGGFVSYLWSTGETTQSIFINAGGTYTVTATNINGCTTTASTFVIENPNPVPIISGITSICQGNSTTLSPGVVYSCYLWSTGATAAAITVSTAGTYYVTVCDMNGCTGSDSATVIVNPNPVPVISGNTSFCQGSSTTLDAGAGYACYLWSPPVGTTQTFVATTAGVYTVTVCDASGCTGSDSVTVTVHPLPTATMAGSASICIGNCANITIAFTGTPPFVYSYTQGTITFGPFTTNNNTDVINVCPTFITTYSLISVTDANCTGIASGSATITVNPLPTAVITPGGITPICLGDTVHLSANSGAGYTYQWFKGGVAINGAVNSFYDAFANGQYSVMVTDLNGCFAVSASSQVQVVCFPPLEPELRTASILIDDDIILIPNPASSELTIQSNDGFKSIEIFDLVGQIVFSQQWTSDTGHPISKINVRNFPNGIYFITVDNGKEKAVKKFVKE